MRLEFPHTNDVGACSSCQLPVMLFRPAMLFTAVKLLLFHYKIVVPSCLAQVRVEASNQVTKGK